MRPERRRFLAAASLVCAFVAGAVALANPPSARKALRFGVVSFYGPRLMYLKYQPLVDYLTRTTGAPWELVLSKSYEEATERLCKDDLLLAYLGPATFLRAEKSCSAEPIACLRTAGKATYESWVMVRADSPFRTLADLRGARFGFGDPFSSSSHVVPRAMLADVGLEPGKDFRCVYYAHHESAAQAVLTGEVEACGLRDIVGAKFREKGLRVIAVSTPIPNFPLVISPRARPDERAMVERALLTLPRTDATVRATIASWDEELAGGFAPCTAADFREMSVLEKKLFGKKAFSFRERDLECRGQGP